MLNRRIRKLVRDPGGETVTHFVYDRDDGLLDFFDDDGAGPNVPMLQTRFLNGPNVDQVFAQEDGAGNVRWLLTDHLGTTRDLIDNAGNVINHITYDAYGNVIDQSNASDSTRRLFTGREFDAETGLYYYRARYYDPAIGRFLSEDPLGFIDGPNSFAYVNNRPLAGTDPFGLQVEDWGGWWTDEDAEWWTDEVLDNTRLLKRLKELIDDQFEYLKDLQKRLLEERDDLLEEARGCFEERPGGVQQMGDDMLEHLSDLARRLDQVNRALDDLGNEVLPQLVEDSAMAERVIRRREKFNHDINIPSGMQTRYFGRAYP